MMPQFNYDDAWEGGPIQEVINQWILEREMSAIQFFANYHK